MSIDYEINDTAMSSSPCPRRSSLKSTDGNSSKRRNENNNGPLHVSFNPNAELVFIETFQEYTPDEILSAYYQRYEYQQIKAENKILTKTLKTGQMAATTIRPSSSDDDYDNNDDEEEENKTNEICYRGLEHKTDSATQRRRQTRFESAMAVHEEQIRQNADGIVDEEVIRDVYRAEVYLDQEIAYEIGALDAIESDLCWRYDTKSLFLSNRPTSSLIFARSSLLVTNNKRKEQERSSKTNSSATTNASHSKTLIERLIGGSLRPERTR